MQESIRLRKAEHQEIPILHNIFKSEIGSRWTLEDFLSFPIKKNNQLLTIIQQNNPIGFIMYSVIKDECDLINIAIDSEHQNQGLGTRALKEFLIKLKSQNVEKVFLEVKKNSNAQLFYQKNGFFEVSVRKQYYSNGADAVILTFLLLSPKIL